MKIKRVGWRKKNGDFLRHSHLSHEMLYISSGVGKVRFGQREYDVSQGDILFIPAGTEHTGPGGPECGVIYLIADHPVPPKLCKPFIIKDDENNSIRAYFENIYEIFFRPDSDVSYKRVEDMLCEIIFELVLNLHSQGEIDEDVEKLCFAIKTSFQDAEFDLGTQMAKIAPSVTYLRRKFHNAMGVNPCRYLMMVRLNHAKKLIADKKHNDYSFTQIAYLCGYSDERYFTRIFKKEFGVPPGEYYKQIK